MFSVFSVSGRFAGLGHLSLETNQMAITEKLRTAEKPFQHFPVEEIKEYADTLLQLGPSENSVPLNNTETTDYNQEEYLFNNFHYKHNLADLEKLVIDQTFKEECLNDQEISHLESLHAKLNSEDDQICGHVFTGRLGSFSCL